MRGRARGPLNRRLNAAFTMHFAADQDTTRLRQYAATLGRDDARQESGAIIPHAGICAGGGPQGPSLP